MLLDQKAIEIIGRARQKNVAAPRRSSADFERIFADFFAGHDFAGQRILDLGPGQYDFAREARRRGAVAHNVDNDPAVVELGRYLGFEVAEENLKRLDTQSRRNRYDGLFCKFSINAFWFDSAAAGHAYVELLDGMLRGGAWGWIAPWNGPPKSGMPPDRVDMLLGAQAAAFRKCGWSGFDLDDSLAAYYGVQGHVANHALFLKNLAAPSALAGGAAAINAR